MTDSRWTLTGRRALITGATRGIGRAIAEELLGHGATVLIVARKADEIAERVNDWNSQFPGAGAHGVAADVSIAEGRSAVFEASDRVFDGRLDILVNNAGTNVRKRALDYTAAEWEHLLATNLTALFEVSRLAHPRLRRNATASRNSGQLDYGAVVNIGCCRLRRLAHRRAVRRHESGAFPTHPWVRWRVGR